MTHFSSVALWCELHDFKWAIVNNRFYWQTNYQTAELDLTGKMQWHNKEYFDEITNS